MHRIGTFQAKTHLAQLLQRVAAGEEITITRRGVEVARLVPARKTEPASAAAIVQGFCELRGRLQKAGGRATRREIRNWINEGRK